jgi:hypothetical protein
MVPGSAELAERRRIRIALDHPAFVACVLILACFPVLWHVEKLGVKFLEGEQLRRHQAVLDHSAPNPWKYRVLSEYVVEGALRFTRSLRVPRADALAFIGVRMAQNCFVLWLAILYYRRLGIGRYHCLLGVIMCAFCLTHAIDNSDLSFNTYTDVLCYLIGAYLILARRYWLVMVVLIMGALNRETISALPVLILAPHFRRIARNWKSIEAWKTIRTELNYVALGLVIVAATFVLLRIWLGVEHTPWQAKWGNQPGLKTLILNLTTTHTLLTLVCTLSVLPIVSWSRLGGLPDFLQGSWWLLIPSWFSIHLLSVYANETRIFLVPIFLVLIPCVVYPEIQT